MNAFFEDYLDLLHERHTDAIKSLEGLSTEALDWKPRDDMNSLSVLVVHLIGAARYWIGDVVMKDPSNRVREAEFKVAGLQAEDLIKRLTDMEVYARNAFETMSLADFEKLRISPSDGQQYTGAYCLLHALEHTALHVGQIQITSELWRKKENR